MEARKHVQVEKKETVNLDDLSSEESEAFIPWFQLLERLNLFRLMIIYVLYKWDYYFRSEIIAIINTN